MIQNFIDEIINKESFNFKLKKTTKLAKIGSLIIYVFFLLSIIIEPGSIYITFWIAILGFFSLIIFSTNHFIFEKYTLSIYLYKKTNNAYIENDINNIKQMIDKYNLKDNINDIKQYINNNQCTSKMNWFNIILFLFLITILFCSIYLNFKILYIIIICLFLIFMNKYVSDVDNGIYNSKLSDYKYVYFCICIIENKMKNDN